ncbi:MAG: hypothetical protein AAF990_23050 [Bacteroidota bacterium]
MKIINRQHIVLFAPYIYVYKQQRDQYYVFITIVHYEGQKVELLSECPAYVGSYTCLDFTVENPAPGEALFTRKLKHTSFMHSIKSISAFEDFNLETFCIKAQVRYPNRDGHPTLGIPTLYYFEDADTGELPRMYGKIALNVPYQLLKNPSNTEYFLIENGEEEDSFNLNEIFDPKCLIFSNDHKLNHHKSGHSNGDGNYKQEIWLDPLESAEDADEEPRLIAFENIHANSSYYRDKEDIDGSFFTVVYHHRKGEPRKRKGRLRNASAGSNPLGFYDNLKHKKITKEE